MKIILDYNEVTGGLTDKNGMFAGTALGLVTFNDNAAKILDLVKQGLTADDLVKLKNLDII